MLVKGATADNKPLPERVLMKTNGALQCDWSVMS